MKEKGHVPAERPLGKGLHHRGKTHPQRTRILVADDDIAILQLSTEVLIHFGYGVDVAADGDAAWQALMADSYDLLITDHDMPKISGVELLKKVRAARMTLPVILVSGLMPVHELTQNAGLRLEAVLNKPYTVTQLLGTVTEVLQTGLGAPQPGDSRVACQSPPSEVGWRF